MREGDFGGLGCVGKLVLGLLGRRLHIQTPAPSHPLLTAQYMRHTDDIKVLATIPVTPMLWPKPLCESGGLLERGCTGEAQDRRKAQDYYVQGKRREQGKRRATWENLRWARLGKCTGEVQALCRPGSFRTPQQQLLSGPLSLRGR